jgi:hypothetical protein
MDTIVILLQVLGILLIVLSYIEMVRKRIQQRNLERQAGEILVDQILEAPEGSTVIIGPATYRTRRSIRVPRDGIRLVGMPGNKIHSEGADPIVHVEGVNGVEITGLHLETAPTGVRFHTPEEPLEGDVKIILDPDGETDIAEIMRREYRVPHPM